MRFIGLSLIEFRKAALICSLFSLALIVAGCAGQTAVNSVDNAGVTKNDLKQDQ